MLMMLLYMLYPEFSILNPCYTRVEYWIKACFFLAVVIMQRTQGRFAEKYDSNQIEITHTAEADIAQAPHQTGRLYTADKHHH